MWNYWLTLLINRRKCLPKKNVLFVLRVDRLARVKCIKLLQGRLWPVDRVAERNISLDFRLTFSSHILSSVVQQCRTCQSIHTGQLDFGEHAKYLRSNDSHPAECLDDEEFSVAEKKLLTARRCTQSRYHKVRNADESPKNLSVRLEFWYHRDTIAFQRVLISSRTSWNYETFPCARLLVSFCGRFSLSLLTQLLVPKIHA